MDIGRAMVCSTDTEGRLRAFEGPGIMAFILITSIKLLIVILGITLLDTFRGWITTLLVSFSFSFCFFSLLFTFLFDNFTTSSYFFSLFPEIFTFLFFSFGIDCLALGRVSMTFGRVCLAVWRGCSAIGRLFLTVGRGFLDVGRLCLGRVFETSGKSLLHFLVAPAAAALSPSVTTIVVTASEGPSSLRSLNIIS